MIKTFNDVIDYYEAFEYTDEYYQLFREASELDLMGRFILNHEYIQSSAFSESVSVERAYFQEAITEEKLNLIKADMTMKSTSHFKRMWDNFIELLKRIGKFFARWIATFARISARTFKHNLTAYQMAFIMIQYIRANKEERAAIDNIIGKIFEQFFRVVKESQVSFDTSTVSSDEYTNIVLQWQALRSSIVVRVHDHKVDYSKKPAKPDNLGIISIAEMNRCISKIDKGDTSVKKDIQKCSERSDKFVIIDRRHIEEECRRLTEYIDNVISNRKLGVERNIEQNKNDVKDPKRQNAAVQEYDNKQAKKFREDLENLNALMKISAHTIDFYRRIINVYQISDKVADAIEKLAVAARKNTVDPIFERIRSWFKTKPNGKISDLVKA